MGNSQKVRIGFVGAGQMGQCAHLKSFVTVPECEVVALAELRPELGRKVAARYGVPRVYTDHEMMLAEEELDGIVASHDFRRHVTLVPELLKAGKPLFTEKPLAATVDAGEKIIKALEQSGTWHMVGYHKRCDPATLFAKAEIDRLKETGELGPMRYVRIQMPVGQDWISGGFNDLIQTDESMPDLEMEQRPPRMDELTWKKHFEFVNYYIHQVNMMRHLLGEPYKVTYADRSGVLMVVESESGVTGTIEMEPYATTLDWHEEMLVAFQRGYVNVKLPPPLAWNRPGKVEILRDPGGGITPQTIVPSLPWVHAMRQQAMIFVGAVRGECKPPCQAREALEDLKIARDYISMHCSPLGNDAS